MNEVVLRAAWWDLARYRQVAGAWRLFWPDEVHVDRILAMYETTSTQPAGSTLAEIIRRIVAAIDPDKIILFGSRARGNARPHSDYDLLVIKDTTERTLSLERAAYRAMKGLKL